MIKQQFKVIKEKMQNGTLRNVKKKKFIEKSNHKNGQIHLKIEWRDRMVIKIMSNYILI